MIKEVKMYTVICDNCGVDIGKDDEYSCWGEHWQAIDNAMNAGWHEQDGKHYCTDCYSFDNDINLILRKIKTQKL